MIPPRTLLGIGKQAEVFDAEGPVLKLYKAASAKASAFREAAHLAVVEARGLPAPRVLSVDAFEGRWGLTMSRAPGEPLARRIERDHARLPAYLTMMAGLHARIHASSGNGFVSLRARIAGSIAAASLPSETLRMRLLGRLAGLPEGNSLCHGDFHPWNILGTMDDPVVVDWLDAASGPPAADVCRSYVLMHHPAPALAAAYVEAYAKTTGVGEGDIRAWLPVVAAARLVEGVPEEEEALMAMADGA